MACTCAAYVACRRDVIVSQHCLGPLMESENLGGIKKQLGAGRWKRREQRRDGGRGTKRELVQEIGQVGGEVWRPYTRQNAKRRGEVTFSILLITYKTGCFSRC